MSVVPSDRTDAQELLTQQVFGVLADGASHSAEQLQAMRDGLARRKEEGAAEIEE